jgi:hypothetical protein
MITVALQPQLPVPVHAIGAQLQSRTPLALPQGEKPVENNEAFHALIHNTFVKNWVKEKSA